MSKDTVVQLGSMSFRAGDIVSIDGTLGAWVKLRGDEEIVKVAESPEQRQAVLDAWQDALLDDDSEPAKYARLTMHDSGEKCYLLPENIWGVLVMDGDDYTLLQGMGGVSETVEEARAALAAPKTLAEWGEEDADTEEDADAEPDA